MRFSTRSLVFLWSVVLGASCSSAGEAPSEDGTESAGNAGTAVSSPTGGVAGNVGSISGGGGAPGGTGGSPSSNGGSRAGASGAAGTAGGNMGAGGTRMGNVIACGDAGTRPVPAATGTPGTWQNVTPAGLDLGSTDVGAGAMVVDPVRPSDIYLNIQHRGTWKSTDYGLGWTKVNTGANGDQVSSGYATYAAIDLNPCRDPGTPPAMYFIQLFGAGGIWKSTDGGVGWKNIWDKNIFLPDGVTNISSDVGGDVHSIHVVDPSESNHLIATLHGYFGSGNNNGVFESTDGGGKWIVRKTQLFTFQPHNNIIFPLDSKTWLVTPGTISSDVHGYRTTDGATSWSDIGELPRGLGRHFMQTATAVYAGTDYNGNAYKSIDAGKTWTKLTGAGGQISWIVATATKLYASGGYTGAATIRHADIAHDDTWINDGTPPGMTANGTHAAVTYDGTHYVVIASQHKTGIWRYLEP